MDAINDGSESVDQFLARIASLKEGRDEGSVERTRRIEEDFQKSRKERQARRLERARSLSPAKTGPAISSPQIQTTTPTRDIALNPPVDFSPRNATLSRSNAVRTSPTLEPKQQDPVTLSDTIPSLSSPATTNTLSRSGTLSWQQRPSGRAGSPNRPRPLSTIVTVRPVSRDGSATAESSPEPTRRDIAASLAAKDPTWFKQTQDRATTSAAFRKTQIEDAPKVVMDAKSQKLPGLVANSSTQDTSTTDGGSSTPHTKPIGVQSPVASTTLRFPTLSPSPLHSPSMSPAVTAPMSMLSGQQDSSKTTAQANSVPAMARSPSPTKGLGGFVQSAMMKRSDSVSKRWSVQATAGLKRGDSVAGTPPALRPKPAAMLNREGYKPLQDGTAPMNENQKVSADPDRLQTRSPERSRVRHGSDAEKLPSDVDLVGETKINRPSTPGDENKLSRSPSKAMDTRRWSPTKSSWLESTLLSQPEPPQITPKVEEQPRWKVDLQRSRSVKEKASTEPQKASSITATSSETSATTRGFSNIQGGKTTGALPDSITSSEKEGESNAQRLKRTTQPDISSKRADLTKPSKDSLPAIERSDLSKKLPPVKPKPQTPPKTDLRANLKSRSQPLPNRGNAEPEFKAVFGKLKAAQIQNYVAPDVLKANILGGKAALSTTDGPQKSQNVDEFKQSIMQKKHAMQTVAEQKKQTPIVNATIPVETVLPEALARRKTLSKATPPVLKTQHSHDAPRIKDEEKTRTSPGPKTVFTAQVSGGVASTASMTTSSPVNLVSKRNDLLKKSVDDGRRAPSPGKNSSPAQPEISPITSRIDDATETGPRRAADKSRTESLEKATATTSDGSKIDVQSVSQPSPVVASAAGSLPPGSKLSSRLNPNLAALLFKGAPRQSSTGQKPVEDSAASTSPRLPDPDSVAEPSGGTELTHMTKGRAKGPKRRAPKVQDSNKAASPGPKPIKTSALSLSNDAVPTNRTPVVRSLPASNEHEEFSKAQSLEEGLSRDAGSKLESTSSVRGTSSLFSEDAITPAKAKPVIAAKSPDLRKISTGQYKQADHSTEFKQTPNHEEKSPTVPKSVKASGPPSTLPKLRSSTSRQQLTQGTSQVVTPTKQPTLTTPISSKADVKSATPLKSANVSKPSMQSVPKPAVKMLRQNEQSKEPQALTGSSATSDIAAVMEILGHYFPVKPTSADKGDFDTHILLTSKKDEEPKSKTISHTMWRIRQDGKKSALPQQQGHILYEDAMYLSLHSYETVSAGKQSEALLWCGDSVPDASIEDVQIFCKRDARDFNAKLEVIRQGKEPATFFQALGGIVIIRRQESAAFYMLCGRQHLGHITFDEVDLSMDSLCSGYSYLISAKFGKLYLWKGKGSAADEIGCARLIGMDLGLTGEIEEVDEGAETSAFWEAFATQTSTAVWSPEWQQRAHNNTLAPALYRVEQEQPKSAGGFWGLRAASPTKSSGKVTVEQIEPYCHRDVNSGSVYILDTYRSVYVLVDGDVSSKVSEFATSLHVAQEMSMLSPSIQNRPAIPPCHVVFGEPPADIKAHFRKWPSDRKSISKNPSACVRLEDVMQALGL